VIPVSSVSADTATGAPTYDGAPVVLGAPLARRIVFDTNVLLSMYIFADSRFAGFREKVECGHWLALTSEACLAEFKRVLCYPMFALDSDSQARAYAAYTARSLQIEPATGLKAALPACSDRDDQKFLELARDGQAGWLVSSDKAVLRLARRDKLRGLFRILTPEAMLAEA
jgi:putative PIN family toxin of toxin-antitoxin system